MKQRVSLQPQAAASHLVRQRWSDLLPTSLDLLTELWVAHGQALAARVAQAMLAERAWARQTFVEERNALIEAVMLAGETLSYQTLVTEEFTLAEGIDAYSDFCGNASMEWLHMAWDAAHLKRLAREGRRRLAQLEEV